MIDDWRKVLSAQVPDARHVLRQLFKKPLTFVLRPEERIYEFMGRPVSGRCCRVLVIPTSVASPSTPSWNQILAFLREMARLRDMPGFAA